MWDKVLIAFREILSKAETTYLTKAKSENRTLHSFCTRNLFALLGFNCTDDENTTALETLRRRSWLALRAKIDEQSVDTVILGKLRAHFEERFRYDDSGIPRVWKPDDDIDGAFRKAKDEASVSLQCPMIVKP